MKSSAIGLLLIVGLVLPLGACGQGGEEEEIEAPREGGGQADREDEEEDKEDD